MWRKRFGRGFGPVVWKITDVIMMTVIILNIKYFPEFYIFYIAIWLLCNYHTSSRPLSRELAILCHISAHVVLSLSPIFFKWVQKWLFVALFSLFNQFGRDLIISSRFSVFQFTYCHLCVYITCWFNIRFCSLYAHCPLFSTVIVCSILQVKVLLIIFRLNLQDFLFVAYYVNFLICNR